MKSNIKKELNNVFSNLISSNFEDVSQKINSDSGVVLNIKKEKSKKIILGGCLSFACLIILFIGLLYFNNNSVAVIGIDVNPSLEIYVNSKNKVVKVNTNNDDANIMLNGLNLKGTNINKALNTIFASMIKDGYITNEDNSVLLSLVDGSYEISDLANSVYDYLKSNDVDSSIMIEDTDTTDFDNELAKKYNISISKIKLIKSIVSTNSLYNFDDLVKLSTNELNLLSNNSMNKNENVVTIGNASESKYKTIDEIKQIIFKEAGVFSNKVKNLKIDPDYFDGKIVYMCKFTSNKSDYHYAIDAITGKILELKLNFDYDIRIADGFDDDGYLKEDEIKDFVIKKTNVTNYYDYKIESNYIAGKPVYIVEFKTDKLEYKLKINAINGEIINYEVINTDKDLKILNEDKIKNIVFNDAKVVKYNDYEMILDIDNNVYDISFKTDDKEFNYKLNAKTGKILKKATF